MTTAALSNLGTTISISATLPATYNQAGYEAVSYTPIGEVTDIGELGPTADPITHQPIDSGTKFKFKGGYDYGNLALKMAKAVADSGQVILTAASASRNDYTFKIETPDLRDYYFTAKVMDLKTTIGAINQLVGLTANVAITNPIIETA